MKKKLVSVLLALTLCGSLAIPVFAEPAGEPSVQEESEALAYEEYQDVHDSAAGNEGSEGIEEAVFTYGHLHCLEEVVEEDGTTWQIGYQCSDESCPYLQNMQITDTHSVTIEESNKEPYIVCRDCKSFNWGPETFIKIDYKDKESPTTHSEQTVTAFFCQTPGCGGDVTKWSPWRTVAHSWSKGSRKSCQSVDDSTHKSTYNYSCVCGATKTEPETESHSLNKYDFGDNYHKGTLHYVEWYCRCVCGYTTTILESQSCPGNNNGEGCIFGINKVKPPVEVQDVTEPEEVQTQEGTEPEETAEPEETT